MGSRLYKRGSKITAYRRAAGLPGGFINNNPQFFSLPNAIEITGLRVQMKVEKSVDKEPNKAEIIITNCSEQTRVNLQTKPLTIRLDAGYDDNLRHVFTGDLRHGFSELDGPDWQTHLELADGDQAYRYAFVSKSYKQGTTIATVLKECAGSMGVVIDPTVLASPELQSEFATGRVLHGPTRDELSRLLAPFGYGWSMQDGRIQILKDADARADQARIISEDTGMIGSPNYATPDKDGKPATLNVKCLLYPELTPGARILVQSRAIVGTFRIEKLTHSADTHGDEWITEIEAKPST